MSSNRQLRLNQLTNTSGRCVVYVMSRDQRVDDNHALLAAQSAALEAKLPLVVVFNVLPRSGVRSREHYQFMLDGVQQTAKKLADLRIGFILRSGNAYTELSRVLTELSPQHIYFDFSPLRGPRQLQKRLAKLGYPCTVVDTHNSIPVWAASDKEEYAAHTFRPKIHRLLEQWLREPDPIKKHPFHLEDTPKSISWEEADKHVQLVPACGIQITFPSGESAARQALAEFIASGLDAYASQRNDPTDDGQTNLSPYLHFGQLSAVRVALAVMDEIDEPPLLFRQAKMASYDNKPTKADSVNALLEELLVRKELSDNYCFYNPHYDSLAGAQSWARTTLADHSNDQREYTYSKDEWEAAATHDQAWNAAQRQLAQTGKMHGYMRMYWAKKLLEWSDSPEQAIQTAVYLNDTYSIDGGDPNGYVGIMWSIAGVHDRPWAEREVFGKIRYMNYGGLQRKFKIEEYIDTWTKQK